MTATIASVGVALPDQRITQATFADLASQLCSRDARQSRAFTRLYNRARIVTRHSVLLRQNGNGSRPEQHFYDAATDEHYSGSVRAQAFDETSVAVGPTSP